MSTERKPFPHEQFLRENSIDPASLPDMLRKRILGFSEMDEDLPYATPEDRLELEEKLQKLSFELEEDLEEYFEELLENNEAAEEAGPAPEPPPPPPPAEPSDQEIIRRFYDQGVRTASAALLKEKGFRGDLSRKTLYTGPYCLSRARYYPVFRITLK